MDYNSITTVFSLVFWSRVFRCCRCAGPRQTNSKRLQQSHHLHPQRPNINRMKSNREAPPNELTFICQQRDQPTNVVTAIQIFCIHSNTITEPPPFRSFPTKFETLNNTKLKHVQAEQALKLFRGGGNYVYSTRSQQFNISCTRILQVIVQHRSGVCFFGRLLASREVKVYLHLMYLHLCINFLYKKGHI